MKTSISNNIKYIKNMALLFLPYVQSSPVYLTFHCQNHCNNSSKQHNDCCNSLLYNTAKNYIAKLQHVKHYLARVIICSPRFTQCRFEIMVLAPCALSYYFKDLYSSLSNHLINATSMFNAHSSEKFQTATINQ